MGLVLSLPDEVTTDDADITDADEAKSDSSVDLLDCFKTLQATGRFVDENQFDCDACKDKKDAEWRVTLQRRPPSLLISFRRTLWDRVKGLHKDSRRVNLPIELDASDLLGIGNEKTPDDDFEGCHYRLVAVVSHSGSSPFVGQYLLCSR